METGCLWTSGAITLFWPQGVGLISNLSPSVPQANAYLPSFGPRSGQGTLELPQQSGPLSSGGRGENLRPMVTGGRARWWCRVRENSRTPGQRGKCRAGCPQSPLRSLVRKSDLFCLEIQWAGIHVPQGKVIRSSACGGVRWGSSKESTILICLVGCFSGA